jgi:hypothetical protein
VRRISVAVVAGENARSRTEGYPAGRGGSWWRTCRQAGEDIPVPLAEKHYSGEFRVRIPPQVHRALATEAAEQGVSLNRLASAKLAA